ncbi:hypothetical protein LXA43DRAFT_477350 [Ganoderma leucocontextum]|nr:hypothetical protein LXA43DRAFT_477350 [Ganoderma leucocontextum]
MEMENDCLVRDLPFPELPDSLASARDQALRRHSSSIPSPFSPEQSRTRLTPRLLLLRPLRPSSTPRPPHSTTAPGLSSSQRSIPNSIHSFLEFTCIPPIIHVRSLVAPHDTPYYLFIVICLPSGADLDSRSSAPALVPHIATASPHLCQPIRIWSRILRWKSPGLEVYPHPWPQMNAWGVFGGLLVSSREGLAMRAPHCRYVDVRSTVDLPRRALVGGIGPRSRSVTVIRTSKFRLAPSST